MVTTQHLGTVAQGVQVCAFNRTRNVLLATRADVARSYRDRVNGLLNRSSLAIGEGLLITPCASIHTIGMQFPIDALFLDKDGFVRTSIRDIQPGVASIAPPRVAAVLELPTCVIDATGTRVGDQIEFQEALSC